jgi:birA, biotin-[acetyl-CoA-carboxylase] ligase region
MNFNIYNYNKIPSTNNEAIKLIKKKNMKQGLVFSKIQTNGRGTRGKKWISKRGNFFGSVFFQLKKNTPKFYEFSVITPVLITKKIKEITDCENIYIKWPNDIYINNQKVCGILQEVIQSGNNQKY